MASFLEKIEKFFSEEEDQAFLAGPPVTYEGKEYVPYRKEDDKWAVWPNATCIICRGLQLKKKLYYNKETETYFHRECVK